MASGMNVIAHNLSAMFSDRQLGITTNNRAKSAEKLGSGYRINRAADDAAGLCISEKMRFKIRGLDQGTKNTQDGISFVQIGDGAMAEINDMLHRMTELSIKAANGTMSERDREDCDKEIQQLKEEINRISTTTKFNTIPVFNNPAPDKMVRLSVQGVPDDLNVYNASYSGGKATYGGIVFHGERISWDNITSEDGNDMVYTDSEGVQRFHEGRYSYTNSAGEFFHLECEEGDEVPKFVRNVNFEADEVKGIAIDGEWFGWDQVKNDLGVSASDATAGDDFWTVDYHGAKVTFETLGVSDLKSMAEAINNMHDEDYVYDWHPEVNGSENVTAVSVGAKSNGFSNVHMTQAIADALNAGKSLIIHADNDGVWLEAGGSEVSNSKMTWSDMGLNDWSNGTDVQPAQLNYTWFENKSSGDKNNILHFSYTLNEVTSKDSVIAGLDGMQVTASGIVSGSNVTRSFNNTGLGTSSVSIISSQFFGKQGLAAVGQEIIYGRDYLTENNAGYQTGTVSYDQSGKNFTATVGAASGSRTFTGGVSGAAGTLTSQIKSYLNNEWDNKTNDILYGGDSTNIGTKAYTFDVKLNSSSGDGSYLTLRYACDFTDTKNTLTVTKASHSTLPTGNSYYAKLQNDRYDQGRQLYKKTVTGSSTNPAEGTVRTIGDSDSVDLASATTYYYKDTDNSYKIFSAADNKFYTREGAGGGGYTYNVSGWDSAKYINNGLYYKSPVDNQMYQVPTLYVLKDDQDGSVTSYSPAVAGDDLADLYYMNSNGSYSKAKEIVTLSYSANGTDITGNRDAGLTTLAQTNTDSLLTKLAAATSLSVNSGDYTKYNTSLTAKSNTAVRTTFETKVLKEDRVEIFDGVNIQHSNTLNDRTWIPRYGMNSYAMGISNASCKTYDGALRTIDLAKEASLYVATKRAIYGGMQNRYEHTVKINNNSSENLSYAESMIRDTQMDDEMVRFANLGIIQQAGQAMLTQNNQSRDYILALLQ